MSHPTGHPYTSLPGALTDAAEDVLQRVQRSLVVLHNGRHGVGAGVVWGHSGSSSAYILTNFHVVAHGRQVRLALKNGSEIPARLLATDEEIDLALLEVEAIDLPAAMVADSRNLRVGQLVLAVGHPWGQRGAVTAGLTAV